MIYGLAAYNWAYIFIGIAAVMDFLDGFAARLLHAYSNLGKELDSLCDAVSFGVAPAMILFSTLERYGNPEWICWASLLIPVFGVLRLAKFNIDTRQTTSFIGLPIPANAIFWIGYTALCNDMSGIMCEWWFVVPVLLVECWLMVSPVKLFSLKFKTWGWKGNQFRWLLIVTAILLVFCAGVPGLMWLIIAYLLYGVMSRD
jgi:CDP-diacylglycerol-serine O-phosphatidyltransferase